MTTTTAVLTPTGQNPPDDTVDPFTAAGLVAALEHAWTTIRHHHPEVPAVVVVIGSGSPTKPSQAMKWGHFDRHRWQAGPDRLHEVLISGEGLARTPSAVFTTLLHEATHGLAAARGIQDTSRQGRWHNKRFATLAGELGMTTTKDPKIGFSVCTLTEATVGRYITAMDTLAVALRAFRHPDPLSATTRTTTNNGLSCECGCPRKIRLSRTAFDEGPVLCALCGDPFLPEDVDRDDYLTTHPLSIVDNPHVPAEPNEDQDQEDDDPMRFYDPTGSRYGMPTYPYRLAPTGLATMRQLRRDNLRPGGQTPAAQILWRKGKRRAYLYRIDAALPKRTATPAQRAAIDRALLARRVCPTCGDLKPYYIPRRYGECLDCAPAGAR